MSLLSRATVLGAVLTFAVSASAQDQDRDIGKIEYQSNCASCHGIDAKGTVL